MTVLKQMGGCFGLIGRNGKEPLYKEEILCLEEMSVIEEMLMNQIDLRFYHSCEDRDMVKKVNTYGCNIEKCNNWVDFLVLTKRDFA